MRKILVGASLITFVLVLLIVLVYPSRAATLSTHGITKTLILPPGTDRSNVISLGNATDPTTRKTVNGYAIIHYKNKNGKSPKDNNGKKGKGGSGGLSCYTYLARGAKWRTTESWVLNPANQDGLDSNTVFNILSKSILKWEDATDGDVTNGVGVDIVGQGSITSKALVADTIAPDGKNEVYFADISDPNAIAVTIVWGIFSGPPFARELVEWDQVYDDVTFDWSAEDVGVLGKMDFDNIATHEIGHSVGMGDLYDSACIEETMYGYAAVGETKKRDLNLGDIAGVDRLY